MSDPVRNVEIEDMLGSIRRLISGESAANPKAVNKPIDRFLLTPALRVMEDEESPQLFADEDADVQSDRTGASELEHSMEASASEEDWESLTQDEGPAEAQFSSSRTALEARIAELEVAVSLSREEWEPDGSEPDAKEMPERHIFAHTDLTDAKTKPELKAADWDEDHQNADEPELFDLAETPSTAKEPDAESAGPGPLLPNEQADGVDELLIDEESLRELVSDIVRQELQGAMGERITRNVRRMVRREIQQALALKDFK